MAQFIKLIEYNKVFKSGTTSIVRAADSGERNTSYTVEMISQIQYSVNLPVNEKPLTYHEVRFTDGKVKTIDSTGLSKLKQTLTSVKNSFVDGKNSYIVELIGSKSIVRRLKGSQMVAANHIKSIRLLGGLTVSNKDLEGITFFEVTMISGKKIVIDYDFNVSIEKAIGEV